MKELSIEEKAKSYDGLIERLKDLKFACRFSPLSDTIDEIFPELKESEDERIRKRLISMCKHYIECYALDPYNIDGYKEALIWLEKQGKNNMSISEATKQELEDNLHKALEKETSESWNEFLDKRGEQKSVDYENADFAPKTALEAIKEKRVDNQNCVKPADKVEPKFKVGEWIVFNGLTLYVKEVVKGFYRTVSKGGIANSYDWDIDKIARLWTIKYAKPGDVLCCESGWTCIFKALNSDISFSSYCFMGSNGWFCETGSESHSLEKAFIEAYNGNIYPATKEQRDTLMKAMADAGYTFNFEKKELKKIEQKSAEWSKDDEDMIRALNACIDVAIKSGMNYISFDSKSILIGKVKNWVKSLKERVQPLPKQEWSEEDNQYLYGLIGLIEQSKAELPITLKGKAADNCIDWLKSLRPQNTWKPSDAQMASITCAVWKMKESACYDSELVSLLNDLEKLREE